MCGLCDHASQAGIFLSRPPHDLRAFGDDEKEHKRALPFRIALALDMNAGFALRPSDLFPRNSTKRNVKLLDTIISLFSKRLKNTIL